MGRERLQPFELEVLLTILRLGGDTYSVPIVLALEDRSQRRVSQAAVFIAMRRLEKKGLLKSRLDDQAMSETGRVRRYFKLTRAGLQVLRETRAAHARLWQGVDRILEKG